MALFRCASGSSGGGATITVTYSADFYGETITCSNGVKTYSKVAPNTGTVDFNVDEEGTWTISCTIGANPPYTDTVEVDLSYSANLETIPDGSTVTPTDSVSKWLECAGITDKAYTTLSQVLGDSETYNALLGDSNACAYMKRSTTWSTDICASQYAMNLLGQYDTACDALLSDSTWASAIANSTYFESVLNVKVPVMTSNTTPEGEVVYSADLGGTYAIYKAFDGNTSTAGNVTNADNCYFGYHFTSAVRVMKAVITGVDVNQSTGATWEVKGSNDGTTWSESLFTKNVVNGTNETFVFGNNTAYSYYIIYQPSKSGTNTGIGASELQFYGRTSSSEKIHGGNPASGETFYYNDGGTDTPVADPSLLSAGIYTIYSNGLAKATDLTSDYGKTIRICPNTKEIVVRPDIAPYWFGYKNCNFIGTPYIPASGWDTCTGSVSEQSTYIQVTCNFSSGAGMYALRTDRSFAFNGSQKLKAHIYDSSDTQGGNIDAKANISSNLAENGLSWTNDAISETSALTAGSYYPYVAKRHGTLASSAKLDMLFIE